jgi:molybdopterin converting factor small subunit
VAGEIDRRFRAAYTAPLSDVVAEVDHRYPGFATAVDDTLFNFAVNDSLILHGARQQPLHHGDVVEVIPIIAGG